MTSNLTFSISKSHFTLTLERRSWYKRLGFTVLQEMEDGEWTSSWFESWEPNTWNSKLEWWKVVRGYRGDQSRSVEAGATGERELCASSTPPTFPRSLRIISQELPRAGKTASKCYQWLSLDAGIIVLGLNFLCFTYFQFLKQVCIVNFLKSKAKKKKEETSLPICLRLNLAWPQTTGNTQPWEPRARLLSKTCTGHLVKALARPAPRLCQQVFQNL